VLAPVPSNLCLPSQSVLEFPPLFSERIKYVVHGNIFGVGSEQMFMDGGCDKWMNDLVCVCVFLLYSVQLEGQRSPLSTTALMVYLAHS